MKTIIVTFVFIPFYFFGQTESVESIKLDSLIYHKDKMNIEQARA